MTLLIGRKNLKNNSIKAFTLLELILVIFIISVITGFSVPIFKRTFSHLELKDAAFNIAKAMNYAQEMAIIERINYKLNLDFKKNVYWITKLDVSSGNTAYSKVNDRYGKFRKLPRGLGFEARVSEVTFYPDGRSDEIELAVISRNEKEGILLRVKGFGSQVGIEEFRE